MSYLLTNITKIVKILMEGELLVKDWKQFCDLLEIPTSEVIRLASQLHRTISTYDLFKEILLIWASRVGHDASVDMLQEILKTGDFVYVSEKLEGLNQGPSSRICDHFGVKTRIFNFIGRKSELQTLQKFVDSNDFLLTVTGMGGVGKSTLLQKFVNDLITTRNMNNAAAQIQVIWFQCGRESSLNKSIQELAKHIHIQIPEFSTSLELFQKCIHTIQDKTKAHCQKTLLVFDDVDNSDHSDLTEILKFLNSVTSIMPTNNKIPVISIVTSTLRPLMKYSKKSLCLGLFNEEEGIEFIRATLHPDLPQDLEVLKSLCRLVENLPRTLHQAVDRINQKYLDGVKAYGVQDYVRDLECGSPRRKRALLDHPLSPAEHSDNDRTTFDTWRSSIRHLSRMGIEGRWAVKLHKLLSYLDSEETSLPALKKVVNSATFFPVDGTKKIKLTPTADDRLEKALKLLKKQHLVDIDLVKQLLRTHRMLKEITRIQINPKSSQILSEVLGNAQLHLLNCTDKSNSTDWDEDIIRILTDIWKQVILQFPDLVERYAPIGVLCVSQTNCPLQLLSTTVEEMASIFSERDPLLITAKINYFSKLCQDENGNHDELGEGVDLLRSLVAQVSNFLGETHPEVLRARDLLQSALKSRSRLSQFIQVAEDSLSAVDEICPLSEGKITKLLQIGNAYEQKQNYEVAIEYYLGALCWSKVVIKDQPKNEETNIIDRIKHCCHQTGKCIDEILDVDVHTEEAIGSRDKSVTDSKLKFKWRQFFKRFAEKVKNFDASDVNRVVSAMRLDMLPHR